MGTQLDNKICAVDAKLDSVAAELRGEIRALKLADALKQKNLEEVRETLVIDAATEKIKDPSFARPIDYGILVANVGQPIQKDKVSA
eukprot:11875394-Karenia_brevis.AAC.1